ncbi:hypothetical protein [Streptomyces sp. NPDC049555]|uniref:hypothetical protein n=1 Tax=unclassified Streptomyces TaxID=2593676 RepID=UPI00342C724E
MGFWGHLLVGRGGDRALAARPVLATGRDHLVPAAAFADGWQMWCRMAPEPLRPAVEDAVASVDDLVRALADDTGAPALAAGVLAGDCAVVFGAVPAGTPWAACLGRVALARHLAGTGLGPDDIFPAPRTAAAHCAAWAAAAGRVTDAGALARVLAADPGPDVVGLFRELLAGLGMVEEALPACAVAGRGRPKPPPPTGEAPAAVRCEPW